MYFQSQGIDFGFSKMYFYRMANQRINVKSVSPFGVKCAFVPLPDDEAYRKTQKNAWAFRLSAEFQAMKNVGWSVGFFTLTYNDWHLPKVPKFLFKDPNSYTDIPCFSKRDIQKFMHDLRKRLAREYGIEQVKYMICSEFGSKTHRPHYHGVICWPENGYYFETVRRFKGVEQVKSWCSKPCPDTELHSLICELWSDKGFVRPRYASGGVDSHGKDHKSFRVDGDFQFCAKYCGKYCCKDLYFYDSLKDYESLIDVKCDLFRKFCAPFHFQTRSLGASILNEYSTEQDRLHLLFNGAEFYGSDQFLRIPTYIRNKLVFDNHYIIDPVSGKRLVRRDANEFFTKHYKEIYEHKAEFYAQTFKNLLSPGYLEGRGVDADNAEYVSNLFNSFLTAYQVSVEDYAKLHLSYFGVKWIYCFDQDLSTQWFLRYCLPVRVFPIEHHIPLIPHQFYDDLQYMSSALMFGLGLIPVQRSDKLVDDIRDYYKSEVG